MTEQERLNSTDPQTMLKFLSERASDRKLRLFAVACCRRLWELLPEARYQHAVEAVEQYADGLLPQEVAMQVRGAISQAPDQDDPAVVPVCTLTAAATDHCRPFMCRVADYACYARSWNGHGVDAEKSGDEEAAQTHLLRCAFGPLPFRPVTIDLSWRTPDVLTLANGIYQDRAFDRMPILADALQDAGCENADILNHCRQSVSHVRGCWVIDLLLGKE